MLAEDWSRIVRALGVSVRDLRRLVGWSQQRLADQAVVSQGAISRLECGDHDGLPLHTVVVVLQTLARAMMLLELPLAPTSAAIVWFVQTIHPAMQLTATLDPAFVALVHRFQAMPDRQRAHFLQVMQSTADLVATIAGPADATAVRP